MIEMKLMGIFTSDELTHHAYALIGDVTMIQKELLSLIESNFKISAKGNSDVRCIEVETLGIDEAREIKAAHFVNPVSSSKKFFIISFDSITSEAQNSLLKTLEEPAGHSIFFLIIPNEAILLPTLKSRLNILRFEKTKVRQHNIKKFLDSSPVERAKILEAIIGEKDKNQAIHFLDELERYLSENVPRDRVAAALEEILRVKAYLFDRSPSVKMLLEHISLVV